MLNDQLQTTQQDIARTNKVAGASLSAALAAGDPFLTTDVWGYAMDFDIPLNQPEAQSYLKRLITGSNVHASEREDIELEVNPHTPLFPDKAIESEWHVAYLASTESVHVQLGKKADHNNALWGDFTCGPESVVVYYKSPLIHEERLTYYCRGS